MLLIIVDRTDARKVIYLVAYLEVKPRVWFKQKKNLE